MPDEPKRYLTAVAHPAHLAAAQARAREEYLKMDPDEAEREARVQIAASLRERFGAPVREQREPPRHNPLAQCADKDL